MLEYVKNVNSSLKYLIHYGDDNKYQYDPNEVASNSDKLRNRFLELVTKDIKEPDSISIMDNKMGATELDYLTINDLDEYLENSYIELNYISCYDGNKEKIIESIYKEFERMTIGVPNEIEKDIDKFLYEFKTNN